MNWLNREYGLSRKTDQKFRKAVSSGWFDIEQKTENGQNKVIIRQNRKRLIVIFLIVLFFLIYIFLIVGQSYFLFIAFFCLLISPQIGFLSKKTSIIEHMSDGSISIQKQAILKSEITVYRKEENPSLKLIFKDSQTNQFGLAIATNNKITVISFVDAPFPFNYNSYRRSRYDTYEGKSHGLILRFSDNEVKNISTFLSIHLVGEIKNV